MTIYNDFPKNNKESDIEVVYFNSLLILLLPKYISKLEFKTDGYLRVC